LFQLKRFRLDCGLGAGELLLVQLGLAFADFLGYALLEGFDVNFGVLSILL